MVTNGKGTISNADVTDMSVTCTTTPARFLVGEREVVAGEPCIKASAIDSTSGALTATSGAPWCGAIYDKQGYLLGIPAGPMVVDPQGRFLYMALDQGQIGLLPVFAY